MTRTRFLLLLALVAAIGGGIALHRHRQARTLANVEARRQATVDAAAPAAIPAPVTEPPLPALTRQGVAVDPIRSAHDWMETGLRVIQKKNAAMLGTDVAHLLGLPPAKAWQALTARARDGDADAATAALSLANDCATLDSLVAAAAPTHGAYVDHLVEGMPADWSRLVRALDDDLQQRLATRIADCEGVGGVMDFALMALDRFIDPDDPRTQLDEAIDNENDAQAITDLRQLSDELRDIPSRRALAERLMKSRNAAEQDEGRQKLFQLANEGDAAAIVFLAVCLRDGCGLFAGDRPTAGPWVEHAAGLGSWPMIGALIGDRVAEGRSVDAFAWSLYRLELAQAGCFESGRPQISFLAEAAHDVFSHEKGLTDPERAQARTLFATIHTRWSAEADAWLGCAG